MALKAIIDFERCEAQACEKCLSREACDVRAIVKLDKDSSSAVLLDLCYGCGKCVPVCPAHAVKMVDM